MLSSPMLKLGLPGLILAVVLIHLGLAHPALSRSLPPGSKPLRPTCLWRVYLSLLYLIDIIRNSRIWRFTLKRCIAMSF